MADPVRRLEITPDGNFYCQEDPGEVSYSGRPKRRSVTVEEAAILAELARGLRVLEIGTGLGVGTRALASTAQSVITLDVDPWVTDPQLPNVTFLRERPDAAGFDLVFIDGSHETESVIADIEYCRPIPTLVLHDTYLPTVQEAIRAFGLVEINVYPTRCRLATYRHIHN
jgi:predicted RNA methylase